MRGREELKLRIKRRTDAAASRTIVVGRVLLREAVLAVCPRVRDVLPPIAPCHRKRYKMRMLRQYVVGQQVF